MKDLLPSSLIKVENTFLSNEAKIALPEIMKLYLVHNQSFLTDFMFLGFPFHYWYTAQFLLILFVILCLIYAVLIDRMNREYDFIEET
jgi:putative solute:sodium symporter small subunit